MGLPDLYQAAEAIHQAVIAQVANAAQAAEPVQQLPTISPAIPSGNAEELLKTLVGLGGWGSLLVWLAKFMRDGISAGISEAFAPVTLELKAIRQDVNGLVKTEIAEMKDGLKRLGRELRRIRHSPPPAAYSDDDMPAVEGRTSKGTKSHQGAEQ